MRNALRVSWAVLCAILLLAESRRLVLVVPPAAIALVIFSLDLEDEGGFRPDPGVVRWFGIGAAVGAAVWGAVGLSAGLIIQSVGARPVGPDPFQGSLLGSGVRRGGVSELWNESSWIDPFPPRVRRRPQCPRHRRTDLVSA
jgi:hypothetical protein